ncbi:MAG TPA: type II toxin-antitoxin system VapC family toxin [Ilumatobacter sp.]|nr:type II toxin-antitoxin system VapC family toxin [Ilumatobacter sp.]
MTVGYLIDTNVVSELRKGERADAGVRAWFVQHAADHLWLSALVIGELRRGVELLRRRDAVAGELLNAWLQMVMNDFSDHILPVTTAVCQRWALLNVPDPLPTIDGLIAATAIEHDLVLVTRNVSDVERTGVALENPFTGRDSAS